MLIPRCMSLKWGWFLMQPLVFSDLEYTLEERGDNTGCSVVVSHLPSLQNADVFYPPGSLFDMEWWECVGGSVAHNYPCICICICRGLVSPPAAQFSGRFTESTAVLSPAECSLPALHLAKGCNVAALNSSQIIRSTFERKLFFYVALQLSSFT